MKIWLSVSVMLFLCSIGTAVAPHPTLLTARYKNQMLPVIKVIHSDPVVVVKQRKKRIRYRTVLVPQRVENYSQNYMEIVHLSIGTSLGPRISTGALYTKGNMQLKAILKPTAAIEGGFMMVGVSNILEAPSDNALINTEFIIRELPHLAANRETKFEFTTNLQSAARRMDHFVQIFDPQGREILTNKVEKSWAYYAVLEKTEHNRVLEDYLKMYADKNHQAFPVVRPKPLFPPSATISPHATAILTLSPRGYVTEISIEKLANPLHQAAIQALEGWLFMPMLVAGKPVSCRVQVPILF